jgi:hypothetical protein
VAKLQVNDKAVDLPLLDPAKAAVEAQMNDNAARLQWQSCR